MAGKATKNRRRSGGRRHIGEHHARAGLYRQHIGAGQERHYKRRYRHSDLLYEKLPEAERCYSDGYAVYGS